MSVTISGNYAYVGGLFSILYIIDISDPISPFIACLWDSSVSAPGVTVSGIYVYLTRFPGLTILDISNPVSPSLVSKYHTSGWSESVAIQGNFAFLAEGKFGIKVIDISNPTSPSPAGSYDTPGHAWSMVVRSNYAYIADNSSLLVLKLSTATTIADQSTVSTSRLSQNYPNPFNPATTIQYSLPTSEYVTISVYNSLGQLVKTLMSEQKPAGEHNVIWDGTNHSGMKVSSGLYLYSIIAGEFRSVKKMLLVK
jgi:hypothetical protein